MFESVLVICKSSKTAVLMKANGKNHWKKGNTCDMHNYQAALFMNTKAQTHVFKEWCHG